MKSERGVTLTSLIIYVIAMLITVTIITIVTSYFYKNVDITTEKYTYFSEFTSFESNFSEETMRQRNRVLEISPEGSADQAVAPQIYLYLASGNQYTYVRANKAIYKNNVKIVSGVEDDFSIKETIENGKPTLTINISIQDKTRTMKYTFQN